MRFVNCVYVEIIILSAFFAILEFRKCGSEDALMRL